MKRAIKTEVMKKDQSGARRTIEISFRVTPQEHDKILKLTSNPRVSIADFIRFQIFGRESLRKLPETAELVRIAGGLGKIGSNINQIAKYFNSVANGPNPEAAIENYAAKVEAPLVRHFASVTAEIEALKAELGKL